MKVEKVGPAGLLLIEMPVYRDARGFFMERFRADRLAEHGVTAPFVQDNHSRSEPGVLRGLHYQNDPAQGKLVGAVRGRIWDVAVDIRKGSPTFGKWYGTELSDENGRLLWIPHGFAHGFCVLGNSSADLLYKVTGAYNPKTEGGIRWDDPDVAIQWPIREPSLSPRDEKLPFLRDL